MNRETGKDRWRRVPKDYFKTRDRIQSVKLQLSGLACLLALGWWATGLDWNILRPASSTNLNSLRANHGVLAKVHSAWDNKCDACHVPFEPIDGRTLFTSTTPASGGKSDQLCMSCHAGPAHHVAMLESEVGSCAECHRDHQGRDFSLVRLPDNECTRCHGALEAHVALDKKPAGTRMYKNVNRFDQDHPAFTPDSAVESDGKLKDRGKLKFNHARHMMPGIVNRLGDTPYAAANIPIASERARYQGTRSPQDPIQLDCASCHQLDSTEVRSAPNPAVASATFTPRSDGRYYLPVSFEADCRACHSLSFDPAMKDVEVPHGVQPDQVVAFLKSTYAAQVLSDSPKLLDVYVPAVRLPGKSPVDAKAGKRLDDAVNRASAFLFPKPGALPTAGRDNNANNCLECHYYGGEESKNVPARVEATNVPEIWFTHASFDHTAHRGVSCRDCHAQSYAIDEDGKTPVVGASVVSSDVLLPAIDNCKQCHAPARGQGAWLGSSVTGGTGGVSYDCNECHRYHNGDRVLQGYGAQAQGATLERGIAEFLEGASRKQKPRPATESPSR